MADDWDLPTENEIAEKGGNYLETEGVFHLLISEVRDGMSSGKEPKPIDGFSIDCEVQAGTALDGNPMPEVAGKLVSLTIWKPKATDKENQIKMAKKKAGAFFVATDLVNPNVLGQRVGVEVTNATGRQFAAKLVNQMEKDDKGEYTKRTKYMDFHYSDIWHVDDPECTAAKNVEALAVIAKELRHNAEYFAFKKPRSAADGNVQAAPASNGKKMDFSTL